MTGKVMQLLAFVCFLSILTIVYTCLPLPDWTPMSTEEYLYKADIVVLARYAETVQYDDRSRDIDINWPHQDGVFNVLCVFKDDGSPVQATITIEDMHKPGGSHRCHGSYRRLSVGTTWVAVLTRTGSGNYRWHEIDILQTAVLEYTPDTIQTVASICGLQNWTGLDCPNVVIPTTCISAACPSWTGWSAWSDWVVVPGTNPCVQRRTRTKSRDSPCRYVQIIGQTRTCPAGCHYSAWDTWVIWASDDGNTCFRIRFRTVIAPAGENCTDTVNVHFRRCVDNPCATGNGGCEHTCTFGGPGVSNCSCNAGYALDADGLLCTPHNPCADAYGGCEQICTYTGPGASNCSCFTGFAFDADGIGCSRASTTNIED